MNNDTLVKKQLEAYNRRDIDAFCACYHPEVIALRLASNQIICQGMSDFRKKYSEFFAENPNLHCEIKNHIVLNNTVIDEEWVTGIAKAPAGYHTVAVYAFRDGLIDRIWFPE